MAVGEWRAGLAKWSLVLAPLMILAMVASVGDMTWLQSIIQQGMIILRRDLDPATMCLASRDDFQVWEEYQKCIEGHVEGGGPRDFRNHLRETWETQSPSFPWTVNPGGSAVLVEFRPLERQLRWSVGNALDNLPVSWCIHIAGSGAVLDVIREAFSVEILVQKIRLLDLMRDDMAQDTVSAIFADKDFFNQLVGEYWLTFQLDSAICAQQRHLLKEFIRKDYGWWGAPWRWGGHEPYYGGNGGFSLRQKRFTMEILDRYTMDPITNEDGWFFHRAQEMLEDGLSRPLAPFYDAVQFSVETVMHTKPFGVHQVWHHLTPDDEMAALMSNCPEVLRVMPKFFLDHWRDPVCGATIDRTRFVAEDSIPFNWTRCASDASTQ